MEYGGEEGVMWGGMWRGREGGREGYVGRYVEGEGGRERGLCGEVCGGGRERGLCGEVCGGGGREGERVMWGGMWRERQVCNYDSVICIRE